MFSWFTRLWHWLVPATMTVFTVVVVVAAVGVSFLVHTEPAIRLAGLCLQLLGIAAAALGIRDTRRMFGKPSFLQLLRSWTSSWPRFKPKVQDASASESVSIGLSASGNAWQGVAPDATLEQRLDAMEANLKSVEWRLYSAEEAITTNQLAITSKVQKESDERRVQIAELHRKVEAASTDGLRLAAAGAFWLAIGVVLSTAAPELLALSR